nr:putative 27-kDa protein a [Citrus associated ampelovirus 1]
MDLQPIALQLTPTANKPTVRVIYRFDTACTLAYEDINSKKKPFGLVDHLITIPRYFFTDIFVCNSERFLKTLVNMMIESEQYRGYIANIMDGTDCMIYGAALVDGISQNDRLIFLKEPNYKNLLKGAEANFINANLSRLNSLHGPCRDVEDKVRRKNHVLGLLKENFRKDKEPLMRDYHLYTTITKRLGESDLVDDKYLLVENEIDKNFTKVLKDLYVNVSDNISSIKDKDVFTSLMEPDLI